MEPPNVWWSARLAEEVGGRDEPMDGLIFDDRDHGLLTFGTETWGRLAKLPEDAIQLLPAEEES